MPPNTEPPEMKFIPNIDNRNLTERRNHNKKQPINNLPEELLARIFLVTTQLSIRLRGAYQFTLFPDIAIQVCSQWMKVAIANHALWTHIHIVEHFDDDNVALWVSRAGPDALFDIEIDMLEPYCGVAFFDITDWQEQVLHIARIFKFFSFVKAGPQRWRSLSLSVLQPEPMYKFIQLLNKHPAPNLRHLYLCSEPDRSDDEFHEERCLTDAHYRKGYSLSEHAVPNLRHAELTYVSWRYIFDRPKPLLSGLSKLELSAGTVMPELVLPNIHNLLSANPNLRWLRISAEFAYDYEFDRLPDEKCPKPVLLSSLEFLSLEGGDNISLVSDILSIITAPSLDGLMLTTGQPPMSENSILASTNKSAFPLLRKLDITGLSVNGQIVMDLLASLPLLTHLAIGCHAAGSYLDSSPHILPSLESISLSCWGDHQHYQKIEDFLRHRAQSGTPIAVVNVPRNPEPEPGFEEKFPGTVLRTRDDGAIFVD